MSKKRVRGIRIHNTLSKWRYLKQLAVEKGINIYTSENMDYYPYIILTLPDSAHPRKPYLALCLGVGKNYNDSVLVTFGEMESAFNGIGDNNE